MKFIIGGSIIGAIGGVSLVKLIMYGKNPLWITGVLIFAVCLVFWIIRVTGEG